MSKVRFDIKRNKSLSVIKELPETTSNVSLIENSLIVKDLVVY